MNKKYELIGNACNGCYRIRALKDFYLITSEIIKKGDLGGRIHGEHNLSQEGNCWVGYEARALDNSRVLDNAVLKNHSDTLDDSTLSGNAVMKDCSTAYDHSTITGNAVMKDCSIACKNSIITGNALLQADQHIQYGTVTTDLLGTKDLLGALYAELGVVPKDNKVILYKKVWSTKDPDVFKSIRDPNFLYKIGKISKVRNVDEDIFKIYATGLHFSSLEFLNDYYDGNTILKCEIKVPDIIAVQCDEVRARRCKVLRVYKGE